MTNIRFFLNLAHAVFRNMSEQDAMFASRGRKKARRGVTGEFSFVNFA